MSLDQSQTTAESYVNDDPNAARIGTRPQLNLKPWHRDMSSLCGPMSDSEYSREKDIVAEHCLSRIQAPGGLRLGKNRRGEIMAITTATKEELDSKLIGVRLGADKRTHRNWKNAATHAMKHLSLYYGHHDVGLHKAWQTTCGNRRQVLPANVTFRTDPFCDNIILEFDRARTTQEPIITATEMLNWLGLVRHKRGSTSDAEKSFHPSLIGKSKVKISLANVSLLTIEILRKIMLTLMSDSNVQDPAVFEPWLLSLTRDLDGLKQRLPSEQDTDLKSIINKLGIQQMYMLKNREHVILTEFDLTYDYCGCLDAEALTKVAERQGHQVLYDHKCGLNCVKMVLYNVHGKVHSRTYNKFIETVQQGTARSDEISCKSAYLLNPTTTGLRDIFRRPDVQQHGITRNELTFFGPNIPKTANMISALNKHSLMLGTALVSCSLQDQLLDMESYVQRSILVYWPEILPEKLLQLRKEATDHDQDAHQIHKQPEGGLVRWKNQKTGKFNGVVLLTPLTSRTSEHSQASWTGLVNLAALATTCASNPVLFLGVYGHDQFLSHPRSGQQSKYLWFLALTLRRVGETELATYLPYCSDFKTENFKNVSTSFSDVGIDIQLSRNIRPKCLARDDTIDYSSIKLDIDSTVSGFSSLTASEPSTEGYVKTLGCPKHPVLCGAELKHLPEDFTEWTKGVCRTIGRGTVVDFEVSGQWFRVPKSQSAAVRQLLAENPSLKCLIKRKTPAGGLVYQALNNSADSGPQPGEKQAAPMVVPTNSKSARELPVLREPMTILGASYDGRTLQVALDKTGNFFVPKSVVTQLKDLFRGDGSVNDWLCTELIGCLLVHSESQYCHVKGNTNKEELVAVLDRSGNPLASNKPSSSAAGTKRSRSLMDCGADAGACSRSKRQREG
jgi:hypothetical protein